ncbi:sensor histidine kinase [Agromyces larvae]|uniref:histidine kinase n=1 Tax=Agromyces larvae TaxID=2929802 RepID=A0ABY4C4E2_9MICO|nr:HAMP domain-containing sensor histidine kinase [Agromyces larvae]UOE43630.1 HAMP domain-containing histidine kinase [Agromyces larvae]
MRARLLLPLLLFGLLAVIAFVLPAAEALAVSRSQQVSLARSAALGHLVQLAEGSIAAGDPAPLEAYLDRFHDVTGESVLVVDGSGDVLASVGGLDSANPEVERHVRAAIRNLPRRELETIRPWSEPTALLSEPIPGVGETSLGGVVLEADLERAVTDVGVRWLAIAGVGSVLLAGLAILALRFAQWVLRPVRALDDAANAFAERRDPGPLVVTGPPELRQLEASFTRMATGMNDTLEQQRTLVADASHQLRNPLAAIRLRVDSVREDVDAEEIALVDADLDRLERTVDRMLALANAEHRATAETSGAKTGFAVDSRRDHTVPTAAALAEPHRPLMHAAGQHLIAIGDREVRIACRRSDLEEIVATVLENARAYAGPGATVRLRLERDGDLARVEVSDDGPGLDDEQLARAGVRFWRSPKHRQVPGTGLGLAIVGELVRANAGTLRIDRADEGGLRVRVEFGVIE